MIKIVLYSTVILTLLAANQAYAQESGSLVKEEKSDQALYIAKDYSYLKGMKGFSDEALELHFTLYKGYVKNSNLILQILSEKAPKGMAPLPEWSELKRRLGWEFNGMKLHELYFENLGGDKPLEVDSSLYKQIIKDFGSYENWKQDFISSGQIRGIGWVVLYLDPNQQKLVNTWINEHDLGNLAGGSPLLIMDLFEHAYLPDYKLERLKYINAFFDNINWKQVTSRFVP